MASEVHVSDALADAARRLELPVPSVAEAAAVLMDPAGPGAPWCEAEVIDALADMAMMAWDGALTVPATTLRWICAIDAGEVPQSA
ncbi:hypothetical protein [Streptomyces boncukensis]|uniref:Uncharacterized protein n=1 Tax=Streptomyces boncukensis TaxID=2711219 RepID=A0A6G4WXE6_9ACTN|nr:hypothetical protein [Streptomyces boncukensis]NGO69300.1 hypothetical protein [Streptomyces boncukensis]